MSLYSVPDHHHHHTPAAVGTGSGHRYRHHHAVVPVPVPPYHRCHATPRHGPRHLSQTRSVRSVGSSTGSRLKSPARTVIHKNVSTSNSSLTYVHIKITFTNKQGRVTRYCDLFVTLLPPRSVHCTVATAISITNRTYCTLIHALIALSELDLYIRSQLLRCLKDTNSASVKSLEDV